MYTRNREFYDLVGGVLPYLGFTGAGAFNEFVNETFAERYNAEEIFSQEGFPLNPDIPLNPTFNQIEATVRPYTMAGYVDIDSDGPSKSTQRISLKSGGLPTFKHEVYLDRKIVRERMLLAQESGNVSGGTYEVLARLLFSALDDLLGGNYNTMLYQRHQIVSNLGKLVINAVNNPMGIPLELDFGVPAKNIKKSSWYSKDSSGNVTQESAVGTTVDPIKVLKEVRRKATDEDFAPTGHWEIDRTTFDDMIYLPYFRQMYSVSTRPDITDADMQVAYANVVGDDVIKTFIERAIGAPIRVIDSVSSVEKFDAKTKRMQYTNLRSFNEGVMVYVPDGDLGDVQCGRPVYLETPGSRVALYDGGRTLIRQVFNDENMTQVTKSEVTGLVVPNKTQWFYYVTIKK